MTARHSAATEAAAGVPRTVTNSVVQITPASARGVAAGPVPATFLTEGVLKDMFLTKLRLATAAFLVATPVGVTIGVPLPLEILASDPPVKRDEELKSVLANRVQELWKAIREGDETKRKRVVDPAFWEVTPAADGTRTFQALRSSEYAVTMGGVKLILLGKESAILTYTVVVENRQKSASPAKTTFLVSTAWTLRGGEWVAVFNQETRPDRASGGLGIFP